jgi:hypothetical protein
MKKLTALILVLITLLGATLSACADGTISDSWKGEVISMQVSLFNQANSSSGYSRKLKNGQEFYILSSEGNWFYVAVLNDNGGYDYGYVMSYYVVENPKHLVLRNASGIYAYAAPYNTDKRVGTVSNYERFTVIATTGNYYIVSFRNAVCYLPMDSNRYWVEEDLAYLLDGAYTQYTVSTNNAKVYGYASTRNGQVATLKAGTVVDVFYTQDGFAAIRYNTVIAFVSLNDLSQG